MRVALKVRPACAPARFVALFAFVLAGCGAGGTGAAPAPPPIVRTLTWSQQPGTEIVQCHTFKLGNATPLEVERIRFAFGSGSHHVHVYHSSEPAPDGVTDCSGGINWPRWRLVVGAQTKPLDWQLPDGLTLPVETNAQLLVQVHWLNTTAAPIDGRIDLTFFQARAAGMHVGVMFGIDEQVAMQPGERKRVSHFCPLPDGSQVIAMMGHFHTLGRAYGVWLRGADETDEMGQQIYRGLDENTLLFQSYAPAVAVGPNQGLEFQCDYTNSRDIPITWGPDTATQEHCNMAAYYYPASTTDDGFCIKEADDVGTLTALRAGAPALDVGDTTELTVETAAPLEADTDVPLAASDPSALDVPASVRIPAHARSAAVVVRGLRPAGSVGVTATLGTQTMSAALVVRGLLLSELMVRPAQPDQQGPWVEIANTTSRPIDLGPYHLGIGGGAEAGGGAGADVPLSGTLAPFGCLVVTGAAPPAIDRTQLGAGLMMMSGLPSALPVGLDAPVPVELRDAGAGAGAPPLDTLSYGPAAIGTSLLRLTFDQWDQAMVPTPGICELRP
jgi:hypothetical protein